MSIKKLRVAVIADELTTACLSRECDVISMTPLDYWWVIRFWKPDLVFVESAWRGAWRSWAYKIATRPDSDVVNGSALRRVVELAREREVPCICWNKEDSVHYKRFSKSAALFDYVFTVDENCLESYQRLLPRGSYVGVLPFPVQKDVHYFRGAHFKIRGANFVGSYSHHVHDRRRAWQNLMFSACSNAELPLTVYDRNSRRLSGKYRFPKDEGTTVKPAVSHEATAQIYRDYFVSLNVNTIEDSASMYSRRLVEILACGGIAVTNPTLAVETHFLEYCHVVHDLDQAAQLLSRLRNGPGKNDLEMAKAGADYVSRTHTWTQRLEEIRGIVGF